MVSGMTDYDAGQRPLGPAADFPDEGVERDGAQHDEDRVHRERAEKPGAEHCAQEPRSLRGGAALKVS